MTSSGDAFWDEWQRLTRFLESTQVAYDREIQSLSSLRGNSLTVRSAGTYEVPLDEHLATVKDKDILFASVLIHSYALAESAAATHLAIPLRELDGIEEWGTTLLENAGASWEQVDGGKAGAAEVAVARNAFAHANPELDAQAVNRLRRAGAKGHTIGDPVSLHYGALQQYRKRLRVLLVVGGIRRLRASGKPVVRPLRRQPDPSLA
ncbi:MAG: hypothetical protein U0R24_11710 [Solirubrobacterales bacterium]